MRFEVLHLGAIAFGLTLATGLTLPLARGQPKPPTISVEEIKDGMKGYGLTVFKGTEPERFDVEVVGVLRNFRPGQELILIRTPHPRLNVTKNVRGMSGSPIYLDGRLAGAYAYSWASFPAEPLAGVTPIKPMLEEMVRPIPPGFWPLERAAPLPGKGGGPRKEPRAEAGPTRFEGPPGSYDLGEHVRQVRERLGIERAGAPMIPVATPLMMGGMGDRAAALARRLFEPLGLEPMQAGGGQGSSVGAPEHYVNGGSVGVQLVRGDVSFMGLGTVTHVAGTKLCAFGHPMMTMGNSALPAAIGRVHWIFASEQHSSKIGEAARPLGAMIQDRPSAIVVDETKTAPTFPLTVTVEGPPGPPQRVWRMEVAQERFMTAGLVAAALGSVIESTVSERRDVTWRMLTRLFVRGHGPVDLDDFGVAVGGTPDQEDWARSRVVRTVGDVLNNPWEHALVDRVESTMSVQYTHDLLRLRGAELLDPEVDAGGKARIRVRLVPQAGPEVTKTVEMRVPPELAGRDVEIEVGPGYEVSRDVPSPENLSILLANAAQQTLSPRSIVLSVRLPSQGVLFRSHVASRLPAFAFDALRPQSGDVAPEPFASFARTVVPLDRYVDGRTRLRVRVRVPLQ